MVATGSHDTDDTMTDASGNRGSLGCNCDEKGNDYNYSANKNEVRQAAFDCNTNESNIAQLSPNLRSKKNDNSNNSTRYTGVTRRDRDTRQKQLSSYQVDNKNPIDPSLARNFVEKIISSCEMASSTDTSTNNNKQSGASGASSSTNDVESVANEHKNISTCNTKNVNKNVQDNENKMKTTRPPKKHKNKDNMHHWYVVFLCAIPDGLTDPVCLLFFILFFLTICPFLCI